MQSFLSILCRKHFTPGPIPALHSCHLTVGQSPEPDGFLNPSLCLLLGCEFYSSLGCRSSVLLWSYQLSNFESHAWICKVWTGSIFLWEVLHVYLYIYIHMNKANILLHHSNNSSCGSYYNTECMIAYCIDCCVCNCDTNNQSFIFNKMNLCYKRWLHFNIGFSSWKDTNLLFPLVSYSYRYLWKRILLDFPIETFNNNVDWICLGNWPRKKLMRFSELNISGNKSYLFTLSAMWSVVFRGVFSL